VGVIVIPQEIADDVAEESMQMTYLKLLYWKKHLKIDFWNLSIDPATN
jgi:hypothetical protein